MSNVHELRKEASKFTSNITVVDFRPRTNIEDSLILVIRNDLDAHHIVN
jgi:hypothetical protein